METVKPDFRRRRDSAENARPLGESAENITIRSLNAAYREQLDLCDRLEEIADSLPAQFDRQQCMEAAATLGPMIRNQHRREEQILFPWIALQNGADQPLANTLARLTSEHFEDECFAEELADTLQRLGAGEPVNTEALGYMLRGFFEGMRRHIAGALDAGATPHEVLAVLEAVAVLGIHSTAQGFPMLAEEVRQRGLTL